MDNETYSQQKANDVAVQAAINAASSQAKMSSQIEYLVKGFDSLNAKVDNLPNAYVAMRDFTALQAEQMATDKKVETLQKYVWMGIGALFVLNLALRFFIK